MKGVRKIKKVRVTVPYFFKEKLLEDEEYFGLSIGEIGNRIFTYYSDKDIENNEIKIFKGEIIQFNLNKSNDDLYYTILKEHNVENEAEFFRNLFFKYLDNPRYLREKILFSNIISTINLAIEKKKKINIKYNGEIRTINPYLLKVSSNEDRTYIFSFCEKNNEYRNYKIANIENVFISKNDLKIKDSEYISNIDKNFDPFLSYNKYVVIKITPEGEKLFNTAIINRPKVYKKEGNTWTLECTKRLAKIYFPQFLSNIEILEPLDLREWFIQKFKKAYENYGE